MFGCGPTAVLGIEGLGASTSRETTIAKEVWNLPRYCGCFCLDLELSDFLE